MKQEQMPTPEEMAIMNRERRASDRNLEDGGADPNADNILIVTDEQIATARGEMNKELKNKKTGEIEKELENRFSKIFYERHKDLQEKYGEKKFEMIGVAKDLQNIFKSKKGYIIEEQEENKKNNGSDIVLRVDTLIYGKFTAKITPESEIILGPINNFNTNVIGELRKVFDYLKEKGIFVIPKLLITYENDIYRPNTPPPSPNIPPSAKPISNEEWRKITEQVALSKSSVKKYSDRAREEIIKRFWNWPRIGERNLWTKHGPINGAMIFCDGKVAIFDTPEGKMEIKFNDLLDPFGYDYGGNREREEHANKYRGASNKPGLKSMAMPLPKG